MSFYFAKDKFWNPTLKGWTPILQPDKWIHLFEFAFFFSAFYFMAYHWSILGIIAGTLGQRNMAFLCAWIIGFGYEVYQGFKENGFSYKDLIADTIGITTLWLIAP